MLPCVSAESAEEWRCRWDEREEGAEKWRGEAVRGREAGGGWEVGGGCEMEAREGGGWECERAEMAEMWEDEQSSPPQMTAGLRRAFTATALSDCHYSVDRP